MLAIPPSAIRTGPGPVLVPRAALVRWAAISYAPGPGVLHLVGCQYFGVVVEELLGEGVPAVLVGIGHTRHAHQACQDVVVGDAPGGLVEAGEVVANHLTAPVRHASAAGLCLPRRGLAEADLVQGVGDPVESPVGAAS